MPLRGETGLAPCRAAALDRGMNKDADELSEPGALQRSLERYAASAGRSHVSVAFAAGAAIATAGVGGAADRRAPLGCLAKLVTASLVAAAARRGALALDAAVDELLGTTPGVVRGVTVRHLLEHTHGLDDSLLAAPRHAGGFIDRAELLKRVAALDRWAAPGSVYSYGNLGAWLLAALLERSFRRAYAELVCELLAPSCLRGAVAPCAALGVGLELTAAELVRFALAALTADRARATAPITPLPGWHPLERGICLGWKAAGGGWFGHQSVWPGASIFLRVQPEAKRALAVVAREQAAALVALGVFGAYFEELFDGRARLPQAARPPLQPGVYAQAARAVSVAGTPRGFEIEAWERDARGAPLGPRASAALVPAGAVLFAQPATELVPYLEVVAGSPGAAWLWNGRTVLRRVD